MKISLKDNERIRQVYRQNPFVLVKSVGLCLVGLAVLGYLALRFSPSGPLLYLVIAVAAVLAGLAIKQITIWRLNQYVITNQRLLHYAHRSMFSEKVTETPHERILNVSYKHEGVMPLIAGYGDVIVQVVGLIEPIVLKNISQPMEIKDYLWEMHKRVAKDMGNVVYGHSDATHVEERVGYTKPNSVE